MLARSLFDSHLCGPSFLNEVQANWALHLLEHVSPWDGNRPHILLHSVWFPLCLVFCQPWFHHLSSSREGRKGMQSVSFVCCFVFFLSVVVLVVAARFCSLSFFGNLHVWRRRKRDKKKKQRRMAAGVHGLLALVVLVGTVTLTVQGLLWYGSLLAAALLAGLFVHLDIYYFFRTLCIFLKFALFPQKKKGGRSDFSFACSCALFFVCVCVFACCFVQICFSPHYPDLCVYACARACVDLFETVTIPSRLWLNDLDWNVCCLLFELLVCQAKACSLVVLVCFAYPQHTHSH